MRVRMVCLEDGITSCGFRRMAAHGADLNADTLSYYVSTNAWRGLSSVIRGTAGGRGMLDTDQVDEIAQSLADADLVGFSSMTGYSELTKAIIQRLRELTRNPYLIWGGIHPIIHPEDAIAADVDAVCTGEGEFAFQEFFDAFANGRDFTTVKNFWFKDGDTITRNGFLPLMTAEEMESLPFPQYGDQERERIYQAGRGFVPLTIGDYLATNGLGYHTVWSIGCPFRCTYCGNTKFIDNDKAYRKIRHPSARHMVNEIKAVTATFPSISTIVFEDDSFLAISYRDLEEFSELWRAEVDLPFAIAGVIPNYVRRDKFEVLTWAGMNRIRMGIQSGSQRILDFYERPTPLDRIESAGEVCASFAPQYQIPPAYDIIMDNPIETRQDVVDTLELVYRLARPFVLLIYSLKVIPNTELEKQMRERGVEGMEGISASFWMLPPRWANIMLYLLVLWRPPRWLFDLLLKRVEASRTPQKMYPLTAMVLRTLYLAKRVFNHVRRMDFSIIPGWSGYVLWRLGITSFWWKYLTPRPPRPPSRPVEDRRLPPRRPEPQPNVA